mgnify:CR=1 FL=1
MKQYKSIFKPKLVRELLRLGNPIYDIKAWSEKNKKSPFEYAPLSDKQVYNIEEILKNELF